jgi:hypothetical protein
MDTEMKEKILYRNSTTEVVLCKTHITWAGIKAAWKAFKEADERQRRG